MDSPCQKSQKKKPLTAEQEQAKRNLEQKKREWRAEVIGIPIENFKGCNSETMKKKARIAKSGFCNPDGTGDLTAWDKHRAAENGFCKPDGTGDPNAWNKHRAAKNGFRKPDGTGDLTAYKKFLKYKGDYTKKNPGTDEGRLTPCTLYTLAILENSNTRPPTPTALKDGDTASSNEDFDHPQDTYISKNLGDNAVNDVCTSYRESLKKKE